MIFRFARPTVAVVLAAALGVLTLTGCGSNARSTTTSAQASQLNRDLPWPSEVTPAVGH